MNSCCLINQGVARYKAMEAAFNDPINHLNLKAISTLKPSNRAIIGDEVQTSPELKRLKEIIQANLDNVRKDRLNIKLLQEDERLTRTFKAHKVEITDIDVIYHDPILDGLRRFKTQQDRSYEYLREAADEARYETYDLYRFLDTPAERFINDYVIPTLTIASCFIPGTQGITMPRALAATCARVVPALESMAVSYGAIQIYREVTKFFNEQAKEPMGRKGSEIKPASGISRNKDTIINNRRFIGHALDRMQGRGITISVVENILKVGKKTKTYNNRIRYYCNSNKISVITEQDGTVVTIIPGVQK